MAEDSPNYFKFFLDTWRSVNSLLPKAQAAKLIYALLAYYFDRTEPGERELPAAARAAFDMQKSAIDSYRRNSLNGAKNRRRRVFNK